MDLLQNRAGQPDAIKVKIYESLGKNLQVKKVSKKFSQLFAELDVNNDGVISAAELKPLAEKLAKEKGTSKTDLQRLFDHIDANHNGEISREEFEAFLSQVRSTLSSHLSLRLCRVGVSVGSDYIDVFLCLSPMHFKDLTIWLLSVSLFARPQKRGQYFSVLKMQILSESGMVLSQRRRSEQKKKWEMTEALKEDDTDWCSRRCCELDKSWSFAAVYSS